MQSAPRSTAWVRCRRTWCGRCRGRSGSPMQWYRVGEPLGSAIDFALVRVDADDPVDFSPGSRPPPRRRSANGSPSSSTCRRLASSTSGRARTSRGSRRSTRIRSPHRSATAPEDPRYERETQVKCAVVPGPERGLRTRPGGDRSAARRDGGTGGARAAPPASDGPGCDRSRRLVCRPETGGVPGVSRSIGAVVLPVHWCGRHPPALERSRWTHLRPRPNYLAVSPK